MLGHRQKKRYLISAGVLLAFALAGCGSSDAKVNDGMQLVKELDYVGALQQFEEARAQGESARLIARGEGIAYMGLTQYDEAIDCFRSALTESSGWVSNVDYDVNYYLAAAYTKNGQYAEAKKIYDNILALNPGEEDAFLLRGNIFLTLEDFENAKADFDHVLSMDSKNYDRLIEIYQLLDAHGYREVAVQYLQDALDAGDNKMSNYDKGRIYYYMGDYQKASIALEESKDKGGADSYLYLGKSYEATGDYNYASSVYNSYLGKDNTNAEVYNQLGLCELAKQDYQKALEAFQAGMKIDGNGIMQSLSFNEIVAYEYLGDYKKAATLLDNYLKAYPDDEKAERERIFLNTR